MSWWEYVDRIKGGDTQDAVATAVGVKGSTISRWKSGGVDPRHAAAFARHYGRPVLEAFVAAGFLTPAEARMRPAAAPDFSQLSNDELLELVRARMREEVGSDAGSSAAIKPAGEGRVTNLGSRRKGESKLSSIKDPYEVAGAAANDPDNEGKGGRRNEGDY